MIEPVTKSVEVKRAREDAFRIFTRHMTRWWPLAVHSVSEGACEGVTFEEHEGGRVLEHARDASAHEWGRVKVWEPPQRVVLAWYPSRTPDTAQEIEVRFESIDSGTRVTLDHRSWGPLGERARETRDRYETGWNATLARFVEAAHMPFVQSVLFHRPGLAWKPGVAFREQPGVGAHVGFMRSLDQRGILVLGGPFLNDSGGMAVLSVEVARAKELAAEDPSVAAGLLTVEVVPWMTPMGCAI